MTDQPTRVRREEAEYLDGFDSQLELLRNAALRFDQGSLAEAKSLAGRIRVLVHDAPGPGESFLRQIGAKDRLPYLDTAPAEDPPAVIGFGGGLCIVSATLGPGGSSRYAAPLNRLSPERQHPPSAFVDWWNDELLTDDIGNSFSRRSLVLAVANQDGGAHFDVSLDAAYAALTRDRSLASFQPGPGGDESFKNIAPPSIRQVAHELERTLVEEIVKDPAAPFGLRVRNPICPISIHEPIEIGRNEPCPCQSGLKRKRCFDAREPRRRRTMEDILDEVG